MSCFSPQLVTSSFSLISCGIRVGAIMIAGIMTVKNGLVADDGRQKKETRARRAGSVRFCFSLLLVTGWVIWQLRVWRGLEVEAGSDREYDTGTVWQWSEIKPRKDLEWHPCYEKFDCARLDVPLDWLNSTDNLRASIAVIRYNAKDKDNYRGSVIINPGGPGGSGVWFVKRLAPYYQAVVGQNYDIISFDPRGVGASTPFIECFTSTQSSVLWSMQSSPVLDAHPGILYDAYARAYAYSQTCASIINSNSTSSGRFVSTASTARDMLEISEKLGELKLQYWGFSYGTFLGLTFASLFPEKVGRMVLDGNVDAVEYSTGDGDHYLQDTDKVTDFFYITCHAAGPQLCAFFCSSPEAVERRLQKLLNILKRSPVIVPGQTAGGRPEVVSYSTVRHVISSSLYRPIVMFPLLANALAALELGDGMPFVKLSGQELEDSLLCSASTVSEQRTSKDGEGGDPPGNVPPEHEDSEGSEDASVAIMCSDNGGWAENKTVDDFGVYLNGLVQKSKSAGATMASMAMGCVGWFTKAKWRFTGPFEGNTSHPILFISNIADNITPLWSARRDAAGFPGSEILVSNTYGHTSLAAPSRCTAAIISRYFQTGELPAPNTVCEPDLKPFEPYDEGTAARARGNGSEGIYEGELDLDEVLWELMKAPVVGARMRRV